MRYSKITILLGFSLTLVAIGCYSLKFIEKENFNLAFDQQAFSTSYIYAPGMMGTEVLMGRYCPSFRASTGERVTWKSGGHTIGQPHSAVRFPESELEKTTFTLNPIKAFVNSFRKDLFPLIQRTLQEKYSFQVVDNPASKHSIVNYTFNFSQANLGQDKDINCLCKMYRKHCQRYPNTSIVLYGDSRGAATIFNFIATHKPENVKAAILEGIFDNVEHCIKHFLFSDKSPQEEEKLHSIISFCMGSYNKKGICPRSTLNAITDDIPLLLVTSLQDGLVPAQATLYLYKKLHERGFKKVHIVILKNSLHPFYMISDSDDKYLYETVVHAFYKKYRLAYNTQKATQGEKAFAKTQPTIKELDDLYQLPTCSLC